MALKATSKHALTGANKRNQPSALLDPCPGGAYFRVTKRPFGYTKMRYKGLAKNAAQVFALIGLTNRYLARRQRVVS